MIIYYNGTHFENYDVFSEHTGITAKLFLLIIVKETSPHLI
jgi:hypothetical protein